MISDANRLRNNPDSSYEKGVFSEEDRKKIRQCLTIYKDRQYPSLKQTKSAPITTDKKPSITEKIYRKHFAWTSYSEELDEVPMLFLIRLHLWPYLLNQTVIQLEELQSLCEMSGISSIALDQCKKEHDCYIMKGIISNGGPIGTCTFKLKYTQKKDSVQITELDFHRKD
mgnify:CR=1 FL=1|tara:strand:+ start:4941 stop:5450 length:510 start_codon:yes stop_codon:yes gene_type:complete